ncbi:betaine-aldehyde dehydrogenase [Vulcanimicrobium alpinum]|uniref:Betaine-aldehyde dehydrogenase n=1 Tax=Vulcanimicrobium alpinum TaxID=3016050 RepID=A0AAN1XVX6_UNVUL|nr:aldehyde dehydrogenase family protein [Vulcanimicrobium alpinum]BDE06410.1 betaine-aldehyde dehydrogenase [Vulcanimicrobium alpinum]
MALAYAPSLETAPVRIAARYDHFIGGRWTPSSDGATFVTIDPAHETELAQVAAGSPQDIDRAVAAARDAYERVWKTMRPADRAKYLYRIARAITERSRELAVLETKDGGKPIKESRDFDVVQAAAHFFYYAGWADKLRYALPGIGAPAPVGVVGSIVPWNFPLLMAAWKIAPALACGNTVVLKPAETTPLTALVLAQICEEAELPPGVVNVVTGDGTTGAALVAHPGVDKIAFTGSTEVGKIIQKTVAGTSKRLTLELGGKAANIVFADAPLDQAVEGVVNGIYFNQGHVCCAGSRLLVAESVHDEIVDRLRARIEALRVGDPLDKNTDIGAINSAAQHAKIAEFVASGVAEGATLHQQSCALPERGFFFRASFFTGVSQSHRIAREEIFGPVLSIMTFRTADEAIEKANNTPYGLSAGVWTDKGAKSMYVAQRLRAGVVWCSTFNQFDPSSPFGGYRESGFGREGGVAGLRPYLTR